MLIEILDTSAVTHLAAAAGCSIEEYVNALIEQAADLEAIQKGLDDARAGRVTSLKEFDQAFSRRIGFLTKVLKPRHCSTL